MLKKTNMFDDIHIPGAVSPSLRNKCNVECLSVSRKRAPPAATSLLLSSQPKPADCMLQGDNGGLQTRGCIVRQLNVASCSKLAWN